jgi:ketosteroid isomerase-like protein
MADQLLPGRTWWKNTAGGKPAYERETNMADANVIVREVEAAYKQYIDVFNREDAAGFVGCYTHPHTMLSGEQGLSIVNTEADHHRGYQQIMKTLHKQEWGRSGIDRMQIWPFSDSLAQLVANVTRYKKDGSVLEKLRACYMLRRDGGGWKILAFTLIEAPFSGPGVARDA